MALVNPNIAMSFRQPDIQAPNALAQYAQIQQIQSGQQAQELNKLQIQEYQRAREEEEGTRNFLRGRSLTDPETQAGLAQFGKTGLGYAKLLQEQQAAALTAKNTQSQIDERNFGLRKKTLDFAWSAVGDASTPEAAIAQLTKGVKDGVFDMKSVTSDIQKLQKMTTPEEYRQFRAETMLKIVDAKDKLSFMLPKTRDRDTGGVIQQVQDNPFLPGYGQPVQGAAPIAKTMLPGESERLKNEATRIKQEGQRINLEGRRVAVLEQNAIQNADPAFQQRMSAARATGEAIAKGDVQAIQALPKVIGDAELAVGILDQMVGKRDSKTGQLLKGEKTHPGFGPAVGMGGVGTLGIPGLAQIIPGTDAANFKTLYDQITGAAFSEAFETLKGGGAITEKEGAKATAARNRMSLAQSEDEFVKAALEYRDIVVKGVERAQAKSARATTRMAPAAPAAGGVIDFRSLK